MIISIGMVALILLCASKFQTAFDLELRKVRINITKVQLAGIMVYSLFDRSLLALPIVLLGNLLAFLLACIACAFCFDFLNFIHSFMFIQLFR